MRPCRLSALLAMLALLLQALAPLAPARAELAVICGADAPVTLLLDLASGQPVAPAEPEEGHDCCLAGAHCGGCAAVCPPEGRPAAFDRHPGGAALAGALPCPARAPQQPNRARAPPPASEL